MLGSSIDVHTGGVDLKFPHHDNELAQSEVSSSDITCTHPIVLSSILQPQPKQSVQHRIKHRDRPWPQEEPEEELLYP